MTIDVSIRKANLADAEQISLVYLESRKTFVAFAPLIHTDAEIHEWVRNVLLLTTDVFVAESENRIVGFMALRKVERQSWIEQLYLSPRVVDKGIGTLLIAKAKSIFNDSIYLRTFQANILARKFYEKNGFVIIEYADGSQNEEKCPDLLYVFEVK